MNTPESCDLCGLPIESSPVIKRFDGEEKHFCCQGCARVYEVAHENNLLDQVKAKSQARRPVTELIFDPGETAYFSLDGMWCAGCAVAAEQILRNQPGVKEANVSFAAERGRLQFDPDVAEPDKVIQALNGLGYRGRLLSDAADQETVRQQEHTLWQLLVAAGFGMQVMLLYIEQLYPLYASGQFNTPDVLKLQYLVWLLATPVLLYGGSSFLRGAWRAVRARTATMDTLVALGTLSAYGYSVYITLSGSGETYFDSVAMITAFVMIGRYLEKLGGTQARKDIRNLLKLQPETAHRRDADRWEDVPAARLEIGDTVLIKPGERVPADAEIVDGQGSLDEALLTGESMPVSRGPGEGIYAGTVVSDAALVCKVTRPVGHTRLAQITHLVEQTLAQKPPIQRLADRASAYFALGIALAALLTAIGWIVFSHDVAAALLAAVAVLVVACPCALGLATPLAMTITLGRTAQAGILVRNPVALETAAHVQRMVFDKTGTLTRGRMTVREVIADPAVAPSSEALLQLAAAVEQFSEHPIAKAIVDACQSSIPPASEFRTLTGLGASARVDEQDGQRVMVGSTEFLGIDGRSPLMAQAQSHTAQGETAIWVGWEDTVAGFIVLRDEPNPTARQALSQLREAHLQTVVLSGDNPDTTQAIGLELGLDDYAGHCLPADKANRIQAWQAEGEQVAMVGDGVNDAPALAQANLSITTAGGTDIAGETSDLVLTGSDLTLIPWFLQLSRRTRRIILENLGWAFAYNLVAVPLAIFGVISPVIAAVAMATSSLLVVGNSLRLRR